MKRRNFLQGLIVTPAIAKSIELNAGPEPIFADLIDYGNFGIVELQVIGTRFKCWTEYPQVEWLESKGSKYETITQDFTECLTNSEWAEPVNLQAHVVPYYVIPVNEKTAVFIQEEHGETHSFMPKWEGDKFRREIFQTIVL